MYIFIKFVTIKGLGRKFLTLIYDVIILCSVDMSFEFKYQIKIKINKNNVIDALYLVQVCYR